MKWFYSEMGSKNKKTGTMRTITTTEDLAEYCTQAAKFPYVTVDTEFLRERTYYAKGNAYAAGLTLGLSFEREFGWAKMESAISVVPSFQAAQNFYVRHESALNMFRGDGPLSLKLGVSNDLRGQPLAGQVRLDTAFFLRAVYAGK